MNMPAINKWAVLLTYYVVLTDQGSDGGQQIFKNLQDRLPRYNSGVWQRPYYQNNHRNWSYPNLHIGKNNQTSKAKPWTQPTHNIAFNENNFNQTKDIVSLHGFKEYQTHRPNFKPSYILERNLSSLPPWSFLPSHHKLKNQSQSNNKKNLHKTYIIEETNENNDSIKFDNAVLAFNRTKIIQILENPVRPNVIINAYSNDEPNSDIKSVKNNSNNFSEMKTKEIEDTRKIHNIYKTDHVNNPTIPAVFFFNDTKSLNNVFSLNKKRIVPGNIKEDINLWMNDVILLKNKNRRNTSATDDIMKSPFNKLDVPAPNFRVPGRRISESKCYEYLWYLKKRVDDPWKRWKRTIFINSSDSLYRRNGNNTIKNPPTTVGGRDTIPGEFPHMGALGWKAKTGTWIFKCGSSLISHKFLLTAAHCSRSPPDPTVAHPEPEIVRLGDKNIADVFSNDHEPFDIGIRKIIVHPKYSSPKQYYDIALVELEKEVKFTKYTHAACLWTSMETRELVHETTVTGWGVIESAGLKTSPELQAAVVDILDIDVCNYLLRSSFNRNWCGFQDHQICAGKLAGGVDACQGDSGGPLQVKIPLPTDNEGSMHFIIGVISFGVKCARPQLPGIYTRVASFLDWIEQIVWPLG